MSRKFDFFFCLNGCARGKYFSVRILKKLKKIDVLTLSKCFLLTNEYCPFYLVELIRGPINVKAIIKLAVKKITFIGYFIHLKGIEFCHKLKFSNPYIFGPQCHKPLIFQTYII